MKRIKTALAVAGLSMALAGVGQAAFAGNSQYCSGAWVCVYKNSGFNTGLGYRTTSFSLTDISAANNDEVSSWENRRGTNARWYKDAGGYGTCYTMAAYSENSLLNLLTQNDTMSSWAGNGGC